MKRYLLFFLLLAFISGCSHTQYIPFTPDYSNLSKKIKINNLNSQITFTKGNFFSYLKDNQIISTFKRTIHNYDYYPGRSYVKVFFEGMRELVVKCGHKWDTAYNKGDVRVDIKLTKLSAYLDESFIDITAKSTITLEIDFIDTKKETKIYSEKYTASDEYSALMGDSEMLFESVENTLLKLYSKIGSDENLRNALEKYLEDRSKN